MIRPEYIKQHDAQFRFLFELHKSGKAPKRRAAMEVFEKHFKVSKMEAQSKVQVFCMHFNDLAEALGITLE